MIRLLNCLVCHDVLKLRRRGTRKCKCGKSSGMFDIEGIITKEGPARIISLDIDINPRDVVETTEDILIHGERVK